ncbi:MULTISPECIES: hypothetical protein [Tenacibaculum]|uniref:hypothetical protein n=1 Tax=Tenacibaculum TaxID=104267 RepID=UPI00089C6370|nr:MULTISPECIES: hypothetical protein [unclassified Tenacibaculum]RBW59374.1 hypothetical protein DS884_06450 [Tenacibaculum sp. E3R01]SEE04104.1 hypothetical protein SAMN04487765_1194 [Tenacibaculum sp. MAR_2010_89]
MKKLTEKHIEELYIFTRQHYVEYYDVQTELVDHLANDIEQIWDNKPQLSFEKARDISFKKFGIFGFMDVIEEKQKQLNKKYIKIVFQFIKDWFKLPKIILTVLMLLSFYQIQQLNFAYYIYTTTYLSLCLLQTIAVYYSSKNLKKKNKKTGKRWMLEDIIKTQGIGSLTLILFYIFDISLPTNKDFYEMGLFFCMFSSFMIVFSIIITYITLKVIPEKSEKLLQKQYPEYQLVSF